MTTKYIVRSSDLDEHESLLLQPKETPVIQETRAEVHPKLAKMDLLILQETRCVKDICIERLLVPKKPKPFSPCQRSPTSKRSLPSNARTIVRLVEWSSIMGLATSNVRFAMRRSGFARAPRNKPAAPGRWHRVHHTGQRLTFFHLTRPCLTTLQSFLISSFGLYALWWKEWFSVGPPPGCSPVLTDLTYNTCKHNQSCVYKEETWVNFWKSVVYSIDEIFIATSIISL